MIDNKLIGETAISLMERLEKVFSDGTPDPDTDLDSIEVREVFIIARVDVVLSDHEPGWSEIFWNSSDPVSTHQVGLLESVLEGERNRRIAIRVARRMRNMDENDG